MFFVQKNDRSRPILTHLMYVMLIVDGLFGPYRRNRNEFSRDEAKVDEEKKVPNNEIE